MKTNVLSFDLSIEEEKDGKTNWACKVKEGDEIEVPAFFEAGLRPDVILKSVNVEQKSLRQPYGPSPTAGVRHSVSTWGKGRGVARVQRISGGRKGAESPNNVGGRRAHPPRPEKVMVRKMNGKERLLAIHSALSATANREMVEKRGHKLDTERGFPIVVNEDFEAIHNRILEVASAKGKPPRYTHALITVLEALGLGEDINRAKEGKKVRAGKATMRSRRYKIPRSILIVASDAKRLTTMTRNIPGVEVRSPKELKVSDLAPGGAAGRLAIYTSKALSEMEGLY